MPISCHFWDCKALLSMFFMEQRYIKYLTLPLPFYLWPLLWCCCRRGRQSAVHLHTPIILYFPRRWNVGQLICWKDFYHVISRSSMRSMQSSLTYAGLWVYFKLASSFYQCGLVSNKNLIFVLNWILLRYSCIFTTLMLLIGWQKWQKSCCNSKYLKVYFFGHPA